MISAMTGAGTLPSVTAIAVSIIDRVKLLTPKPYCPTLRDLGVVQVPCRDAAASACGASSSTKRALVDTKYFS